MLTELVNEGTHEDMDGGKATSRDGEGDHYRLGLVTEVPLPSVGLKEAGQGQLPEPERVAAVV